MNVLVDAAVWIDQPELIRQVRFFWSARTWVTAPVDLLELTHVEMALNCGGRYVGMPEQCLDYPQITVIFEQVSSKAVSEQMGVDTSVEAG